MKPVFLFLLVFLATVFDTYPLTDSDYRLLINRGRNYLIDDTPDPDSAVICFSKVFESYRADLPDIQKYYCSVAAVNLSTVYSQFTGDYKSAYETLVKASEISRVLDRPVIKAQIALSLGNIYGLFSHQIESPEFVSLSIEEYRKAFRTACDNQLWEHAVTAFCNFTAEIHMPGFVQQFADEINIFGKLTIPENTPDLEYARIRYKSAIQLLNNDTIAAINCMKAQLQIKVSSINRSAYIHQNLRSLSYLYREIQQTDSALHYADILLKFGREVEDLEACGVAYRMKENIYSDAGNKAEAKAMHAEFLIIQDSILNVQNLGTINNLKFLNDLATERRNSATAIREAEQRSKSHELFLFIAGFVLSVIIPVLAILLNRHRRIRRGYRELYYRQQQSLLKENEDRRLREKEVALYERLLGKSTSAYTAPQTALSQQTRILAVMDETDEKFSANFSLERLSELVGISPRALSAVLNDSLGITFRDMLNQYRVREACNRLTDTKNYGHLTIEAISQSVGYKSRTSLVAAFKKETGLTPSDYQRIAHKSNI